MNAIKKIRKHVTANPDSEESRTLLKLVLALESDEPFSLRSLYDLDLGGFDMAIDLLKDWRLDRYYTSKGQLLDLAQQIGKS